MPFASISKKYYNKKAEASASAFFIICALQKAIIIHLHNKKTLDENAHFRYIVQRVFNLTILCASFSHVDDLHVPIAIHLDFHSCEPLH